MREKAIMNMPKIKSFYDLLSYDTLLYIENFFLYCSHIQYYFDEKLTESELRNVRELTNFIGVFVQRSEYKDAPSPYKEFYSRYQRLYNTYKRLELW